MLHYQYLHINLSNETLLIHAHEDLLHIPPSFILGKSFPE